jgi:hypothetical protein
MDACKRAYIELEKTLSELQDALAKVKILKGLLPICSSCKMIRDDQGYWRRSFPITLKLLSPTLSVLPA